MNGTLQELTEAARELLWRLDSITTDQFMRGGERAERERLRVALDKLTPSDAASKVNPSDH